ncbi:MAG TPA: hypothetical protein VNQ79_25060 [Blastocatellia bacterium]|nr:hypothetical protein [Blastocatellia bacterium]
MLLQPVPVLHALPVTLPSEGAIDIELEQGVLIFRASQPIRNRIEDLLCRQRESMLTADEEDELQQYEEVDDYLSYLNRLIRNLAQQAQPQEPSRAS